MEPYATTSKYQSKISSLDFVCLGVYFIGVMAVAVFAMCRINRATENGYFLAGRFMTWLPVGASLFASNIGSEHFIGLAGSGAASGIAVGAFEFNACILLQLLGWIFLPVYIASRVTTLPEYMTKRFASSRICLYLTLLSLALYVFTKISVNLYSGIIFIQEGLGWGQWFALILLLAVAGFCTITGGLGAVIYTDTLQTFIMIIGATAVAVLAFIRVGGYSNLIALYPQTIPAGIAAAVATANTSSSVEQCNLPKHNAFRMLRSLDDLEMPWLGFILGQTPGSIWYWAADQMMVQRTLAAKSLSHAQGGCIFASFLKLLPLFIMVLPGMISRVLEPDIIACANPDYCEQVCGNRMGCSNLAYPRLVLNLLPQGARGLMLAVMLSALMSDLTSIFNSASTLFTMDVYTKIRRSAKRYELMLVGRVFVIFMVVISVLWIPVISSLQGGQMYIYIQSCAAYLSPQIAAVYLCAILWPRCNEQGAFWALMVSTCVGFARMFADFFYTAPGCGYADERPWFVKDIHYTYIALILFWLAILMCVVISLVTPPLPETQLIRTTYFTRFDTRPRADEQPKQQEKRQKIRNSSHVYADSNNINGGAADKLTVFLPAATPSPAAVETFRFIDADVADTTNDVHKNGINNENFGLPIIYENVCESPSSFNGSLNGHAVSSERNNMTTPVAESLLPLQPHELVMQSDVDGEIGGGSGRRHYRATSPPRRRYGRGIARQLLRAVNWFCGLEASSETIEREEAHIASITTLDQNPRALVLLNVLLILLLFITVFVYAYFSFVPPFIESTPLSQGGQQSVALLAQG